MVKGQCNIKRKYYFAAGVVLIHLLISSLESNSMLIVRCTLVSFSLAII